MIERLTRGAMCLLLACVVYAVDARADIRIEVRSTDRGIEVSRKTLYIKGARQREDRKSSFGAYREDVTYVRQCDLRREVRADNLKRVYWAWTLPFRSIEEGVADFETEAARPGTRAARLREKAVRERRKAPVTVTGTTIVTDTGERQEMFGRTARRIKTVTTWVSNSDRCPLDKARIETDGWYIDLLYGVDCSPNIAGFAPAYSPQFNYVPPGECGMRIIENKYAYDQRVEGTARLGFPLKLDFGSYDEQGRGGVTTQEVTELVEGELDARLFEAPTGFRQVKLGRLHR